jgi:prevent-host-death family protein
MISSDWRLIMGSWPVHDAKARFTESLNTTLKKDPQIVTRRGIQIAVLVPIEDWRRLEQNARPGLKALLLGDELRFEDLVPARRALKRRPPVDLT